MAVHEIPLNGRVWCDYCGDEWTDREECGGILFGTYACCPECEKTVRKDAKKYDEMHMIRGTCPAYLSFRDWCRSLRNGNDSIRITTGEPTQ